MSEVTIIYWRDIPTQIVAGKGRKAKKLQLSNRFMVAVDKAAMNSGASDTDTYLQGWQKKPVARGNDFLPELEVLAAQLEEQYPTSRLAQLARQGGAESQESNSDRQTKQADNK